MKLVELRGAEKAFGPSEARTKVLRGADLSLEAGAMAALTGASGSGKSTLLSILGFLESPDRGEYLFEGRPAGALSARERTHLRRVSIGFVFQAFQLLPRLRVLENVALPLVYQGVGAAERRRRALEALERVGLAGKEERYPAQLSGGEQQRVSIARAVVKRPALLLADEPTGNLDAAAGAGILELFRAIHREGATLLIVTHDPGVAATASVRWRMAEGRVEA